MEKRYQVFISSTFVDLQEERSSVIQTVMEMDCIPAGMELFPAIDEEQFNFIKKIIDDCDYYLVIIGGRYGSLSDEGLSYTEMEYDYAISKGIKVIGLLHKSPNELPVSKTDDSQTLKEKLNSFREKLATSRLVKFWEKKEELPGLVALSLSKTIKTYPAIGWVRATNTNMNDMLIELNNLRKTNQTLQNEIGALKGGQIPISDKATLNLAEYDQEVTLNGTYKEKKGEQSKEWKYKISWEDLFRVLSPTLFNKPKEERVSTMLKWEIFKLMEITAEEKVLDYDDFTKVKIQFLAYQLIKITNNKDGHSWDSVWDLTEKGYSKMIELNSIKKVTNNVHDDHVG